MAELEIASTRDTGRDAQLARLLSLGVHHLSGHSVDGLDVPEAPVYAIGPIDRGDDMRNWSPDEAIVEITARGRRPLTVSEGISWLLQQPARLEPNFCFMTIASRKPKPRGLDARTPAIWISNGTGRDGAARRGAPKVGWCWAGNRHTGDRARVREADGPRVRRFVV